MPDCRGRSKASLYFFAYDRDDPMLLFASTSLGQFYRSLDGGETWSELPRRLGEIRALHLVPTLMLFCWRSSCRP
jgi:hypothetical protein